MNLGNGKRKVYRGENEWDSMAPSIEWFNELQRISENQIIWGANHFVETFHVNSSCWIVWDKGTGENSFADCELAWASFNCPVRKFFKSWVGSNAKEATDQDRIHPTQKPISLYSWLLKKFAKPGDTIFDPMMGSQSSRIAACKLGYEYVGCELDKEYFDKGCARYERECLGITVDENGKRYQQTALF